MGSCTGCAWYERQKPNRQVAILKMASKMDFTLVTKALAPAAIFAGTSATTTTVNGSLHMLRRVEAGDDLVD